MKERKSHCGKGHEFTPENTGVCRGERYCRACRREYMREKFGHQPRKPARVVVKTVRFNRFDHSATCKNGHELTPENIYIPPNLNSRGNKAGRDCKLCRLERGRKATGWKGMAGARGKWERCPKGHPFDEENTRVSKAGKRFCLTCRRENTAKRREPWVRARNIAIEAQGFKCAVCDCDLKNDQHNLDHCHKTGKIRGVLCRRCNAAEGMVRGTGIDPAEWGKRLKAYLARPSVPLTGAA